MKKLHAFSLLFALALTLMYSCKKNNEPPVPAVTSPIVGLSSVSITPTDTTIGLEGNIQSTGGSNITQHGHVYSVTNKLPTLADSKTEKGICAGPFPAKFNTVLTSLKASTTYYVRAYATNAKGTGYGTLLEVKTEKIEVKLPTLDDVSVNDSLKASTFKIQSSINDNGNGIISQHGHVYSGTSKTPTLADAKTELGVNVGPFPVKFISRIGNLEENKLYYVRPYVTNEKGTTYGKITEVKTLSTTPPVLAAYTGLNTLTYSTIKVTNTITNDGNLPIIQYGHLISSSNSNPTLQNTTIVTKLGAYSGKFPKEFVGEFKNPIEKTNYHVRSYATNAKGTVYSTSVPLPTPEALPTFVIPNSLEDVPIYSLKLWIRTPDKANAGSKDRVYVKLNDKMPNYYLDNSNSDNYERVRGGDVDIYEIVDKNIKTVSDIKYLTLTKEGTDNWETDFVGIIVNDNSTFLAYFDSPFNFNGGSTQSLSYDSQQLRNHRNWKQFSSRPFVNLYIPPRNINKAALKSMLEGWVGNEMRHLQDKTFGWWSGVIVTYKNSTQLDVVFTLKNSKSTVKFAFLVAMPCLSGTSYFRVLSPTPTNILDMGKLQEDMESRLNLTLDIPCKGSMWVDGSINYW